LCGVVWTPRAKDSIRLGLLVAVSITVSRIKFFLLDKPSSRQVRTFDKLQNYACISLFPCSVHAAPRSYRSSHLVMHLCA
jgi:hypothetical protein